MTARPPRKTYPPDMLGNIAVPLPADSGLTFTLVSEYGYGMTRDWKIIEHRFGDLATMGIQRYAVGGGAGTASAFNVPSTIVKLLWAMAALTMIAGNVLGLLQSNIKRVLAYSSIAHSGYLLVGVTTLVSARGNAMLQEEAMAGIMFYLAAYGLMNTGAFGVMSLLPGRDRRGGGRSCHELRLRRRQPADERHRPAGQRHHVCLRPP